MKTATWTPQPVACSFLTIALSALSGCGDATPANSPAAHAPAPAASAATTPAATTPAAAATSETAAATPVAAPTETAKVSDAGETAAAAKPAAAPAVAVRPASLLAAAAVLNLADLPGPRGAEFGERSVAEASAVVPLKIRPTFDYYAAELAKRGFKEITEGGFHQVADEYASGSFTKDGFLLSVSIMPGSKPDSSQAYLRQHGNVDTRTLPTPPRSKLLYGSAGSTIYTNEASVVEAAEGCLAALAKAGWQPYGRALSDQVESDDQRFLDLRQGAVAISVMVSKAPAQGDKTSFQYGATLLGGELPWPADSEQVEFDANRLYLTYESPREKAGLVDYYQQQLADLAWSSRSEFDQILDKSATLYFDDANRNRLLVRIDETEEGPRKVRIERITAAELDAIAERAKRNEQAAMEDDRPGNEAPAEEPAEKKKTQIAAADIKLPENAKGVNRNAGDGEITFTITDRPTAVAEFFRTQLTGDAWSEDRRFSVVSDDAAVFEFKGAEDGSLNFTLIRFPDADGTRVTISGDGLNFGDRPAADTVAADTAAADTDAAGAPADAPAEPPAGETLTVEEKNGYPIPGGYANFSSERTPFRQTLNVAHAAPIAKLVEFYRAELGKGDWKETPDAAKIEDETALLKFTGAKGPLSVKFARANDETQIELFTRSTEAAKKAGVLPQPNQAKLVFGNTLKSDVSLAIDGKTIKLKPGEGETKPDGPTLDLKPGKYKLSVTIAGKTTTEELAVEADQTWGVIVLDLGALPMLLY